MGPVDISYMSLGCEWQMDPLRRRRYADRASSSHRSYPNHEAGWLTQASVRKRNRQNEREKNKKAKMAGEEQEGATADEQAAPAAVSTETEATPANLMTGYVRVPQVSLASARSRRGHSAHISHIYRNGTIVNEPTLTSLLTIICNSMSRHAYSSSSCASLMLILFLAAPRRLILWIGHHTTRTTARRRQFR